MRPYLLTSCYNYQLCFSQMVITTCKRYSTHGLSTLSAAIRRGIFSLFFARTKSYATHNNIAIYNAGKQQSLSCHYCFVRLVTCYGHACKWSSKVRAHFELYSEFSIAFEGKVARTHCEKKNNALLLETFEGEEVTSTVTAHGHIIFAF